MIPRSPILSFTLLPARLSTTIGCSNALRSGVRAPDTQIFPFRPLPFAGCWTGLKAFRPDFDSGRESSTYVVDSSKSGMRFAGYAPPGRVSVERAEIRVGVVQQPP